jgi:hypothetical protein
VRTRGHRARRKSAKSRRSSPGCHGRLRLHGAATTRTPIAAWVGVVRAVPVVARVGCRGPTTGSYYSGLLGGVGVVAHAGDYRLTVDRSTRLTLDVSISALGLLLS